MGRDLVFSSGKHLFMRCGVTEVPGDYIHTLPFLKVYGRTAKLIVSYLLKGVTTGMIIFSFPYTLYFYQPLTVVQCSRSLQHMEPIPAGNNQMPSVRSDRTTAD